MMKHISLFLVALAVFSTLSVTGCSESQPTSVTENADQSEIEAWKEKEKQINAEAEGDMELGK